MLAFYPKTTPKIFHKGEKGNLYRLDAFDKCVRLCERIKEEPRYEICEVSLDDKEEIACNLVKTAHDKSLLSAYKTGIPTELANSSGVMWQPALYDYILETALVSKFGIQEAVKNGIALAITGGGHHAERIKPLGFSTINTIAIAALYASGTLNKRTAIIDLDVHYSNGCFDILRNQGNVWCSNIWGKKLDKWKYFEQGSNVWHQRVVNEKEYFLTLGRLCETFISWKPEIVVYHLGMDVLSSDRMGGIKGFDAQKLYLREHIISRLLNKLAIPYFIFFGGAYINYSKGEDFANVQKNQLTELQYKALEIHNKNNK